MTGHPGPYLIFGASRGIGRAVVADLVARGCEVAAVCRKDDDAANLAAEFGAQLLPLVANVADQAATAAAVQAACAWRGHLAGLVNNAGVIDPIGHVSDADPEAWSKLIDINVKGPFYALHAALPRLTDQAGRPGVVVNVSSGAAQRPLEGWSAYCASKAALAMLTRSVALEYAGRVLCYGFRPGTVDTGMQGQIRASGMNPVSQIPRGDLLDPALPALGISWLLRQAPADLDGAEVDIRDPEFQARLDG